MAARYPEVPVAMLNRLRRQVRLIVHRCPYCGRQMIPAEPVPLARRTECCPMLHYGEADFGHFIATFEDGGKAIDLQPALRDRTLVA